MCRNVRKGGLSLMSDELERKRQEKITKFKLKLDIEEDAESSEISSTTPQPGEQSPEQPGDMPADLPSDSSGSDTAGGELTVTERQEYQEYEDVSSSGGDEINSYSRVPEVDLRNIDKASLKKAKKTDRKRRRKKAKRNRIIFRVVWIAMVLFVSVMIGEFIMVGVNDMLGVGRDTEGSVTVTIPENADIDTIADILYDNNVIKIKWFFKFYATMTKATTGFTHGTFEIATNKDYQALINYMQSDMNRTDVVTLQFTEGMNLRQYAKLLEKGKVCSADKFLEACNSDRFDEYEFIKSIPNASERPYKLEGYLFPDTYFFYVGEDVDNVIEKFLANYRRKVYGTKSRVTGFDKKVTVAERAETIGMSMEDVLTLASLIQAEAANKEDMYEISAILHNRLATIPDGGVNKNGETGFEYLQLDSTKYYPYTSQEEATADLAGTDKAGKEYVSEYYTYTHKGLPPGPICNPGMEAIQAALTVGKSENYYFCHKPATEDSPAVPYYAKTDSEHEKNKVKAGLIKADAVSVPEESEAASEDEDDEDYDYE